MTEQEVIEDLRTDIHILCDVILDGITEAYCSKDYWNRVAYNIIKGMGARAFCDSRFKDACFIVEGRLSKHAEVLPEKVVKPDDTLDEGRRGGVVHDVGDGEVDAGRKIGSVFESLCRSEESVAEKFDVAKRIRVSEGVVVGDGTGDTCSVSDGGVSLFGFHASYFTKFKTPGWRPRTKLDYAMTSVFAQAMLGRDGGMMWFNLNRKFAWKGL